MSFIIRNIATNIRNNVRTITVDAKAVRYSKHGHPTTVLKMESMKLDTATMKNTDVLVQMKAAPITPADLAQVTGYAGTAPSFPRVGGNEGLGVVVEAGSNSSLKKGDVVVASKGGVGTWSTHVISSSDNFTKVDVDANKAGIEAVAAAVVPVTLARRLIDEYGSGLKKGDVIVQNGSGSTVGQAIIQIANSKGFRTINILRNHPDWAKLVQHLQGIGATTVVSDTNAGRYDFSKLLADFPKPKLGLNSVGGSTANIVAKALGPSATFITYGNSSGRPVSASLDLFTNKDITMKGYNLHRYMNSLTKTERDTMANDAVKAVSGGSITLLVAREPFKDFSVALNRTLAPHERKIVLVF